MNRPAVQLCYRALAYISVALAAAGVVLPLLPTTPFVLLAAWAASKGSPEFELWLHNHRIYGPIIQNWRDHRAVPRKAKWLAFIMLLFSWSILYWTGAPTPLLVASGLFFTGLTLFLASRPSV
ncbi:YbaN family protein [Marinobacter sp. V034]|uniref:YbaN family protein n=1 Tax=Marinobacter sp. V034 TaxID=3459610 RepID=UPI004044C0D7